MDPSKVENIAQSIREPSKISVVREKTIPKLCLMANEITNNKNLCKNENGISGEIKNDENAKGFIKNQLSKKGSGPSTASSSADTEPKGLASSKDIVSSPEHPTIHSCQYRDLFNVVLRELMEERAKRREQEDKEKELKSVPNVVEMSFEYTSKREKRSKSGFRKWWRSVSTWNFGSKK